jgi:hypothetical protein
MKFTGKNGPLALMEDHLKKFGGDKKETGLDPDRPLGFYVTAKEFKLFGSVEFQLVGFVPVVDEDKFLNTLRALKFTLAKPQQGIHRVTEPFLKNRLFLRFLSKTAYFAEERATLKNTKGLLDPRTVVPKTRPGDVLVSQLNLGQIPQAMKTDFLKEAGKKPEREPGESQLYYRTQLAVTKSFQGFLAGFFEEIQKVVFKVEMDARKHHIALDLAVVPRPGSKLIPAFQRFGRAGSRFRHLGPGSVASLCARLPFPREIGNVFRNSILDEINKTADAKERASQQRLFKALAPAFGADEVDLGLAVRKPLRGGPAGVVAGLRVRNGRQLEHVLRDAFKGMSRAERLEGVVVRWKHSRRGKTLIHTITTPTPIGTFTLFLATGNEVILAASNEAFLKEALDGLAQESSLVAAPAQLDGTLHSLFGFYVLGSLVDKDEKLVPSLFSVLAGGHGDKVEAFLVKTFTAPGWKQMKREVYGALDKDEVQKARFRLNLLGGDAVHLRLELSSLFLKLLRE